MLLHIEAKPQDSLLVLNTISTALMRNEHAKLQSDRVTYTQLLILGSVAHKP